MTHADHTGTKYAEIDREYQTLYTQYYEDGMRRKLGLIEAREDDAELFATLFAAMEGQVDFTNFFRALCAFDESTEDHPIRDSFIQRIRFDQWAERYSRRLRDEGSDRTARQINMLALNPKYVLRNYIAQIAIGKAENKDFSEVDRLVKFIDEAIR